MEKFVHENYEFYLPKGFCEDENILKEIISKNTWDTYFSENEKQHLLSFLPGHEDAKPQESKLKTLNCLLNGDDFHFDNPLKSLIKKLAGGYFKPEHQEYLTQHREDREKKHQLQTEEYYENLFKELLLKKQDVLGKLQTKILSETNNFYQSPPIDHHYTNSVKNVEFEPLKHTANKRCFNILKELKEKLNQNITASSDDDDDEYEDECGDEEFNDVDLDEFNKKVISILGNQLYPQAEAKAVSRRHRYKCCSDEGIDLHELISKHRKRKLNYPDELEVDVSDICIIDIACDLGLKKQELLSMENKEKSKKVKKMKKHESLHMQMDSYMPQTYLHNHANHNQYTNNNENVYDRLYGNKVNTINGVKNEDDDYTLNFGSDLAMENSNNNLVKDTSFSCFFSFIKFLLCQRPVQSSTLDKLQTELHEWQKQADIDANAWLYENDDWLSLLQPALQFLAGMSLDGDEGKSLNFAPMVRITAANNTTTYSWVTKNHNITDVDYNKQSKNFIDNNSINSVINNADQMDSKNDDFLSVLNYYWSEERKRRGLTSESDVSSVIPPSLVPTSYVVGPSSEEDKALFRMQERQRFANPHKAFTYQCHGYKSVVGPVKGIYSKDNSSTKARGHALLMSERPYCVNILTLVNDCAARLPNGEGTRYEICELMKDSQYLSPDITDAQLNAVVSGALDRLHYDKDPSVKYLASQKIWVYRHRNRTEEDFERMHLVHRVTARARKLATSKKSHLSMLQLSFKKQNDKKLKTPSLSDLCQENDSQPQDRLNSLIFNNPKASNSFHKKQAGKASKVQSNKISQKKLQLVFSKGNTKFAFSQYNSSTVTSPQQLLASSLPKQPSQLLLQHQLQQQRLKSLSNQTPTTVQSQMSSILKPQLINSLLSNNFRLNNSNNIMHRTKINNISKNNNINISSKNTISHPFPVNFLKAPAKIPQNVASKPFSINSALAQFNANSKQNQSINVISHEKVDPIKVPHSLKINDLLKMSKNSLQPKPQVVSLEQKMKQQIQLQQKQQQFQQQLQSSQWVLNNTQQQQKILLQPQRNDNQFRLVLHQRQPQLYQHNSQQSFQHNSQQPQITVPVQSFMQMINKGQINISNLFNNNGSTSNNN